MKLPILPIVQASAAAWYGLMGLVALVLLLNRESFHYMLYEWLINYAAGFVRRGLAGEIVFGLAGITGWSCDGLIKLIGTATLAAFLVLYVRCLIRLPGLNQNEKYALLFMPTGVSFILANPAAMIRKDYILFLIFLGFLALMERGDRLPRAQLALYLAAMGSFAVLIHEMFAFLFMPFVALLLWARASRESGSLARGAAQTTMLLAIPTAVACFTILAPTGPNAAQEMCAHAQSYVQELECSPPPEPLAFVGMSGRQALSFVHDELVRPRVLGVPVLVFWITAYCLFIWIHFAILTRAIRAQLGLGFEEEARRIASLLCGLNFLLAAGMSVVGVDLGRWIFILATLATLTVGSTENVKALSGLFGRLQIAHGFPLLPKASPSVYACCVVFAGLSSLIFRFPHCCAQSGISFIMNVPDILIYYGLISS